MKIGGLQFYRRNKFWTKTGCKKGSNWESDWKTWKVKQGWKAIDKVTHQTPGGEGTFRQVLDQATENRKIRHKDWYEVICLWSLFSVSLSVVQCGVQCYGSLKTICVEACANLCECVICDLCLVNRFGAFVQILKKILCSNESKKSAVLWPKSVPTAVYIVHRWWWGGELLPNGHF